MIRHTVYALYKFAGLKLGCVNVFEPWQEPFQEIQGPRWNIICSMDTSPFSVVLCIGSLGLEILSLALLAATPEGLRRSQDLSLRGIRRRGGSWKFVGPKCEVKFWWISTLETEVSWNNMKGQLFRLSLDPPKIPQTFPVMSSSTHAGGPAWLWYPDLDYVRRWKKMAGGSSRRNIFFETSIWSNLQLLIIISSIPTKANCKFISSKNQEPTKFLDLVG